MGGLYFHNTDIENARAHACQILNTVVAIQALLPIVLVAPRYYSKIDWRAIQEKHDLPHLPDIILLKNFWIQKPGILAFIIFNISAIWFLLKKWFQQEISFLYVRSSFFVPLVVVSRIMRIPFFYEIHRKPLRWNERIRDYILVKYAHGLIVISEYLRDVYLPFKKNIIVAHDAVSFSRFDINFDKDVARRKLNLGSKRSLCVYVGTINKMKGISYLYAAAEKLPEFDFLLVGPVAVEFKSRKSPPNVFFSGKKEQGEVPLYLQAADILVLPHPRSEHSQSPMKLFEYMVSKKPIVASDLPCFCGVLNNKNAVLVEPENGQALADGIKKILKDQNL